MKKLCGIMLTALLVACVAGNGWAGEKAKLGPCVRQCVHAYNPSLADSGADEFMADDFRAKECVQLCKESLYEGECNSWGDDCCHPDFMDTDPDCQTDPPTDPPDTGDGLPPDPGEAGKATIEGIDSDQDGLRDDIQRYIALTYPDSEKTRAALREIALVTQKALVDRNDENKSLNNADDMTRAMECLKYIHPGKIGREIDNLLLAEYLNTAARSRAFLDYNEKLGGHVFRRRKINEYKKSCKFDPDMMED
jgi:hypothetical protein